MLQVSAFGQRHALVGDMSFTVGDMSFTLSETQTIETLTHSFSLL